MQKIRYIKQDYETLHGTMNRKKLVLFGAGNMAMSCLNMFLNCTGGG